MSGPSWVGDVGPASFFNALAVAIAKFTSDFMKARTRLDSIPVPTKRRQSPLFQDLRVEGSIPSWLTNLRSSCTGCR